MPCRLLDIQELLSDTGVGRQQHVIISQGQIDAVLNARPEERRLIIEEAAGVLKFRRRKEKAERRLAATEGNLTALQDLLREVRRQLRPLERQADAARRHGDVVAELAALRLHLAGRELAGLAHPPRRRPRRARPSSRQTSRELKGKLAELDTAVMATEASSRPWAATTWATRSCASSRCASRPAGSRRVLAERRRGLERDRTASVDQAVIATLEAESARLAGELDQVEAEADRARARGRRAGRGRGRPRRASASAFETDWADGVAPPSSRAAEVRGELAALRPASSAAKARWRGCVSGSTCSSRRRPASKPRPPGCGPT